MPFWKRQDNHRSNEQEGSETSSSAPEPAETPSPQNPPSSQPAVPVNAEPGLGGSVARNGAEGVAKGVGAGAGKTLWQQFMEVIGVAD